MGTAVRLVAVLAVGLLAFCCLAQNPDVIEKQCDPRVSHRFEACPDGYCCVRDEFLPSWVYCKRLGALREGCTTRDSETNCPCSEGLLCQPNIVSSTGTASLYGKCEVA
ncbi:hypothetical protein ACOMHN_039862 [Nucella lapillus]